jgi:hypothetical protein
MRHAISGSVVLIAMSMLSAAPAEATDIGEGAGALDGLTFDTRMSVAENGATYDSRFSFRDGQFYSVRCNTACDFGWTEYESWEEDGATHFSVVMTCSEAPHTVTWQGRVVGDRVEGSGVWRTERWYWTVVRNAVYDGALVEGDATPGPVPAPVPAVDG